MTQVSGFLGKHGLTAVSFCSWWPGTELAQSWTPEGLSSWASLGQPGPAGLRGQPQDLGQLWLFPGMSEGVVSLCLSVPCDPGPPSTGQRRPAGALSAGPASPSGRPAEPQSSRVPAVSGGSFPGLLPLEAPALLTQGPSSVSKASSAAPSCSLSRQVRLVRPSSVL